MDDRIAANIIEQRESRLNREWNSSEADNARNEEMRNAGNTLINNRGL